VPVPAHGHGAAELKRGDRSRRRYLSFDTRRQAAAPGPLPQWHVRSREQLMKEIRNRDFEVFDRSIDVHVASLRRKTGR